MKKDQMCIIKMRGDFCTYYSTKIPHCVCMHAGDLGEDAVRRKSGCSVYGHAGLVRLTLDSEGLCNNLCTFNDDLLYPGVQLIPGN